MWHRQAAEFVMDGEIHVVTDGSRELAHFYEWAGTIVEHPAVYVDDGGVIPAKKLGILRAMRGALEEAGPCALIVQDDMRFTRDPFQRNPHRDEILSFVDRKAKEHVCPQAFMVGEDMIDKVMVRWRDESWQACVAWGSLPFEIDVRATHHG